ncbi:hypothetical protein GGX14DRAFT_579280 [Mycena pura]|uniref:Uncharacterized protein n=1 Tax=Mycena pura TaxID=153505 RepID=A0AAD6Y4D5_9AGAR|nr:hypothetical protein GGX14DRAFT_579280 [Mycena pura]
MSHQTTDRGECSPTIKLRPAEELSPAGSFANRADSYFAASGFSPLREPVPALVIRGTKDIQKADFDRIFKISA